MVDYQGARGPRSQADGLGQVLKKLGYQIHQQANEGIQGMLCDMHVHCGKMMQNVNVLKMMMLSQSFQ